MTDEEREEAKRRNAAQRRAARAQETPERRAARLAQRRDREAGPEYKADQKARRFQQKHGVSREDADRMIAEREGRCDICGRTDRRHVVDHCHDTGKVRGILCSQCNSGIGMLGDDLDTLIKAAKYLRQHR